MADNRASIDASAAKRLPQLYAAETANAVAAILLVTGLSFYTNYRFGWNARENFTLAACQGAFYTLGALMARGIALRWGRERSLVGLCAAMTVCAVAVGTSAAANRPLTTAALAIAETGMIAASWPMLQSLISAAGDPARLSLRLGWYNILWSVTGAIAFAASGAVIQHAPPGAFFGIIAAGHLTAGVIIFRFQRTAMASACEAASGKNPAGEEESAPDRHPPLDPALMRRHRLALVLSRIALPSTYIIVYSLAPALPSLHAMQQLTPTTATLVGSVWLLARAAAFAITGGTTFWHRRPGLILYSSVAMILAFIGTIVPGALNGIGLGAALAAMMLAQGVLGFSIGAIYAASLYFGMVVSEGSTRHGGYHEALIGLGQVLGPLLGAIMQWIYPGALWPAVAVITAVVSASVMAEAVVGYRAFGRHK